MKPDVQARGRQGVKAVLEEAIEEAMGGHLEAGYESSDVWWTWA